jgi:hypothetical protein
MKMVGRHDIRGMVGDVVCCSQVGLRLVGAELDRRFTKLPGSLGWGESHFREFAGSEGNLGGAGVWVIGRKVRVIELEMRVIGGLDSWRDGRFSVRRRGATIVGSRGWGDLRD